MTTAASIDDPAGPCPGDNTLAAVVDGGGSANGSLLAHLSRCGQCQALVAEILRDGNEEDTRYEIERLIGIGGMGLVVRARDAVLERAVALKVLWRGSADSPGNSAVLAEARTMARFAHPNIVTVHDAGQLPRVGAPFIAMELVDGESLRQWLTRAHSWQEVVDVFVDAAKGLEAAHAVGIVHADFKPANVLLADDGARTRVTDFGLAHHIAGQSDPRRAVGGTPRYTAPEQRERSPDARSDQYAFGVALHEALWGEHPHREGPCPAVGCPSVPSRLRRVVGRCTNEDPALRSPSMTVVIDERRRRPKA
ncbi:MAG: serine/threonine protein kinase, partial [Deltaproteobacteria bacterium]|nr:serine/threonine protein kinase [Deltaproteobacteria bacterium]